MRKGYLSFLFQCVALLTLMIPGIVSAGSAYHSVTVQNDGTMQAWGYNGYGQLGDSTTTDRANPVTVTDNVATAITGISAVATGQLHTLALKIDGTLLAWGNNEYGQLGDGTIINRSNPVVVKDAQGNPITGITAIAAGIFHNLALKSDGTLLAWGTNWGGQLGDGTKTDRHNPVAVLVASGIVAIAAGDAHSLALKSDGTLLAWGNNGAGQVGNGSTVNQTSPVVVTDANGVNINNITAIAGGGSHSLALLTDGTMLAWGYNAFGQLGDGSNNNSINPVVVTDAGATAISNIAAISAGQAHSVALKSDGTVLAWGHNFYGQLGDSSTTNRANPVAVTDSVGSTITGVGAISAGLMHTLLLKSNSTMLSCGSDQYGQLGFGALVNKRNPVAVKTTGGAAVTNIVATSGVVSTADTIPPLVSAPTDIYVLATDVNGTAAAQATIAAFLGAATATDIVDGSVVVTNDAPSLFPVGTTTVTFSATDAANNTGTATARVTIDSAATFYPTNGSSLATTSQRFAWTDTGAEAYYVMVSNTVAGGNNLYNSGFLPAGTSSVNVTGLPTNGGAIYVRHFAWNGAGWTTTDYTFTAAAKTATIASPVNGSTLTGSAQTFTWVDTGADAYYLMVSSAVVGGNNLYVSGGLAKGTTSVNVTGLPSDGKTVYVRLFSWVNGGWQTTDHTYVASGTASINSHTNGSALGTTGAQTFTWANSGAPGYYLSVGHTLGQADIFQSGWLTGTSVTVNNIPSGESLPLFVRLYSWTNAGGWQVSISNFTTSYATSITSPTAGTALTGTTQTFTWTDTGASLYYLDIGSGYYGHGDYFKSGNLTGPVSSIQVTGLPTGSVPLYVRLYTWGANGWNTYEALYTSAP